LELKIFFENLNSDYLKYFINQMNLKFYYLNRFYKAFHYVSYLFFSLILILNQNHFDPYSS